MLVLFPIRQNVFGVSREQTKSTQAVSVPNYTLFPNYTILLKDDEIRTRITTLIDFNDSGTDPFATEVRYHHSCWQEHVSHPVLSDEDHIHLQNVFPNRSKISLLQACSKSYY